MNSSICNDDVPAAPYDRDRGTHPIRTSFIRVLAAAVFIPIITACAPLRSFHRMGGLAEEDARLSGPTLARISARSTLWATLKSPVTTSKVGARLLYERGYAMATGVLPSPSLEKTDQGAALPPSGTEAFEALLDREKLPKRSSGQVTFYVDGSAFFPAYMKEVEAAQESLDVQSYIFDNDSFAIEVADQLKRKSEEIPVRVYYDTIGSVLAWKKEPAGEQKSKESAPRKIAAHLKENSKVQLRTTMNPYFSADHTKLHVIDGRVAFVGGMNLGAEYRYTWHDLMVRVEGPIVTDMARIFDDRWRSEKWGPDWNAFRNRPAAAGVSSVREGNHVPLRLLRTDAGDGKREVLRAKLSAIRSAKKRVWIETPYFSADDLTRELTRAVQRGVDVRVIVPSMPDSKLMKKVNVAELGDLLKTGTRVYEYPGMTHLKAIVCDGWLMFGSANCDTLSMRINRELNIATSDPATVQKFEHQVFEPDFRRSTPLTAESAKTRLGPLAEVLGDQL